MASAPFLPGGMSTPSPLPLRICGCVPLRVDLNFVVVGRLVGADLRDDLHRLAGRLHAVHAGRADADALLPAALPQAVKLRAVQQLAEDERDLLLDDAGAVVLHADLEAVVAGRFDVDPDLGQDAGLLAGVERIVDGFLDRGEQRLPRIVEAQQVAVLGEELADRDVALLGGHRLGRGPAARRGGYIAVLLGVSRLRHPRHRPRHRLPSALAASPFLLGSAAPPVLRDVRRAAFPLDSGETFFRLSFCA